MKLEKLQEMLKNDDYFCSSWNKVVDISHSAYHFEIKTPLYLQRSVTQRIAEIKQPKGGYLPIKLFNGYKIKFDNLNIKYRSSEDAKKFSSSIGLVVDYISRYLHSKDLNKSFEVSYLAIIEYLVNPKYTTNSLDDNECISLFNDFKQKLFSVQNLNINLNSTNNIEIIKNIFCIVRLDAIYRAGYEAESLWKKTPLGIKLSMDKIYDIPRYIYDIVMICISRSLKFYSFLKNVTFGECFGNGKLISTGDCDFISQDTIWDMKVSSIDIHKNNNATKWTLQILIYYLMLKHPSHHNFSKYKNIKNIGIFNPFLNVFYTLNEDNFINCDFIKEVEDEIIGFNWKISDGYRLDIQKSNDVITQLLKKEYPNIRIYSRNNKE